MIEIISRSERSIKLPTFHNRLETQPRLALEPEIAILDSGFAIHVATKDNTSNEIPPGNYSQRSWEIVRALSDETCCAEYKEVFQYLMDISAYPPNPKTSVPKDVDVTFWTGCDLYFLIIEYKKKENVSAVRQLAMQMTAVLHHNVIFGLHGKEFPIYGFAIKGNQVDMYQGWLVASSEKNKAVSCSSSHTQDTMLIYYKHSVYIEQAAARIGAPRYVLSNPMDVVHLYRIISAIRTYGCNEFANEANKGLTKNLQGHSGQKLG